VYRYNRKYDRSGYLFQDRFKSKAVETDGYFIMSLLYIYQNPVKAGVCVLPSEYEWGSRRFLGKKNDLIDEAELLAIIPIETIKTKEKERIDEGFSGFMMNQGRLVSDRKANQLLRELSGMENAAEFQLMDRDKQKEVILGLLKRDVSIRQAARIPGTSKGVVERWGKAKRGR
jgi:hypothetical protein